VRERLVDSQKGFYALALRSLEAVLETVPESEQPEVARNVTSIWFAEVVDIFSQAAASGEHFALWTPSGDAWLDGRRRLNSSIAARDLKRLAALASRNCRTGKP
jgi:hypothetical protein